VHPKQSDALALLNPALPEALDAFRKLTAPA
jgi:hypothetical protein